MSLDSEITPLLDERQEWLSFSQPSSKSSDGDQGVWDSHVVIQGMHCAACAFNIESALLAVPGVRSVEVSASTHRAKVVWSDQQVKPSGWFDAIARAGYRALPAADNTLRTVRLQETRQALWRWLVAGFCMMQVMMYAYPSYVAKAGDITPDVVQLLRWASWVLSLPVVLFSCGPFFSNALRDIKLRRVSMDFPVALGMAIAFLLSSAATFDPSGRFGGEVYYDSLTMFVFFLLTGRWLELRLRDRTAGSLEALMNRLPDTVLRQTSSGEMERITVRRVCVGDVLSVLPGESFCADGVVVQGQTMVDEALLTGESHPQLRQANDLVVAGSYNLSAAVSIRVTQVGESTQFARIVSLMEDASLQKPRLAALADRMAKPFLIGVLILATLVAMYWWPTNPNHALMLAVAVLVVTCPCALSLATPAAMLATAGAFARRGVLVRRLQAIEALADVDIVIFDKTGTLTRDAQRVEQTWVAGQCSIEEVSAIAASMAQASLHPLSKALVKAAGQYEHHAQIEATQIKEYVAQGLEFVGATSYRLGSISFCQAWGVTIPSHVQEAQVHLCDAHQWLASWRLDEDVREDAITTVAQLHALGVRVQMLSGDQTSAVARVAHLLELDESYGGCSPEQKLKHLQTLQSQGKSVLMVGDGLNDGPVLAGSHVSMAFGQAAALTQSNADLVLLGAQLGVVTQCLTLARKSMRVVRQNLVWAAAYNLTCVPLAALGFLPAWAAGLGMACSSLLVVLNSLRLSRSV
jgi:Cu2+-exporting ATPase